MRRSGTPGIIGSTGAVRARAWICGFSSTLNTAAFDGGARYRPTTSRILSTSSGSGEILNVSVRHGCSPNARQMRCTLVGEMPTRAASSRFDQCVPPSGTSSKVRTTTSSTWASVMVRGTPGRGSSVNPSSRSCRNRARHLPTVMRLTPNRAATAMLLPPWAHASTIRARSARPCAVLRRLAQFSNLRRSSSDNTSGSSLVSPTPPAQRRPAALSPPDNRPETKHDSSGDERTQDRLTSCQGLAYATGAHLSGQSGYHHSGPAQDLFRLAAPCRRPRACPGLLLDGLPGDGAPAARLAGNLDPAGLRLRRGGNGDAQNAIGVIGREVAGVHALTKGQAPDERALRPLGEYHMPTVAEN